MHRISKGVINFPVGFNNTIVFVTNVWGRVVPWSSTSACGWMHWFMQECGVIQWIQGYKKRDIHMIF